MIFPNLGTPSLWTLIFIFYLNLFGGMSTTFSQELARSGPEKVSLLELFTSESCSSCPPADQWFSALKNHPQIWKKFVPVIFHVDYWNHLHWKDSFSRPEMTQRQRDHANTWTRPAIYTPGVVLNGKEWRDWSFSKGPGEEKGDAPGLMVIQGGIKEGIKGGIRAEIKGEKGNYKILFSPRKNIKGPLTINIVLLGMGIISKISSGENSGKTLTHDFVVLLWKKEAGKKNSQGIWEATFSGIESDKISSSKALGAWVEEGQGPVALQAIGFPL